MTAMRVTLVRNFRTSGLGGGLVIIVPGLGVGEGAEVTVGSPGLLNEFPASWSYRAINKYQTNKQKHRTFYFEVTTGLHLTSCVRAWEIQSLKMCN